MKSKHHKFKINNLSILNPQLISKQHSELLNSSEVILLNQSKNINTKFNSNVDVNSIIGNPEVLIQSKERVKKLAEVYTAKREVDAMLNLLPKETWDKIDSTFLEPSCGDGNFIEAIITKKLDLVPRPKQIIKNKLTLEYDILRAISSVYGIDICSENIDKCKIRVLSIVKSYCSNHFNTINLSVQFEKLLRQIIDVNYIVGDTLNDSKNIVIVEWEKPLQMSFRKRLFKLNDLSNPKNKPFKEEQLITFNGR